MSKHSDEETPGLEEAVAVLSQTMSELTVSKPIVLKSSDGETVELEEVVAVQSQTIKHMIDDDCAGDCIPVPNVTGEVLAKAFEYCRRHSEANASEEEEPLEEFDSDFIKVDNDTLFDLIMAANYLDIKGLVELGCKKVAGMIKGKTFNITNDFTPEEEEDIRKDVSWAFGSC